MSDLHNFRVLCLNSTSKMSLNNIKQRFDRLGIKCSYYDIDDVFDTPSDKQNKFNGFAHLDMIYDFYYNSQSPYGIFCENDIYIHKDIQTFLPKILLDFNILRLDILVLGYELPFIVDESMEEYGFSFKKETNSKSKYTYHNYPDDLNGAKMYILSRKYAEYILERYYRGYIDNTFIDNTGEPFTCTEFIITSEGNRAVISPTIACVNTRTNTEFV